MNSPLTLAVLLFAAITAYYWTMAELDFAQMAAHEASPAWTMTPDEIVNAAKDFIAEDTKFNDAIAAIEHPTVANVLDATTAYENANTFRTNQVTFYKYVSPDKAVRDASTKAEVMLDEHEIEQGSRVDLFRVYNALWEQIKDDPAATDPESYKVLEKIVKHYKRNGLGLPEATRDQVKKLKIELSNLATEFSTNTNEENGHVAFTKAELDGVPDLVLEQYETVAEDGVDKYKVTFKYPDILPLMKYARNEDTRKRAHVRDTNKVPENADILDKMVRIRYQIAKLLGYNTYAEFVLEERMAKNQKNVMDFLDDLTHKLLPLGAKEIEKMLQFKNEDLAARGLPPQEGYYTWDHAFYNNLLLEKEYLVDDQKISEYFPLALTIDKMLGFYELLFDVKFVKVENPDPTTIWHEDVHKFAVYQNIKHGEPKGVFMGWILFDLHPREGKYTHAAQFGLRTAYTKADGSRAPSYAALVCNFTKPTKKKPSLLRHSEVVTFFHELGHGVHSLLSQTKHARFQGTHVPRDFVECPSQMLEFWTWSKNELKNLSSHYETGEPIPDDLIDQLILSKHVNSGLFNLRQLTYGLFDMNLHIIDDEDKLSKLDMKKLWNELRENVGLISHGGELNIGYSTFGHIAGGYESGYYGYLYSQVFATDIYYTHFKADPMNEESGLRYRDVILKPGGSKEILDILEELLGRPPNSDSFLQEILPN